MRVRRQDGAQHALPLRGAATHSWRRFVPLKLQHGSRGCITTSIVRWSAVPLVYAALGFACCLNVGPLWCGRFVRPSPWVKQSECRRNTNVLRRTRRAARTTAPTKRRLDREFQCVAVSPQKVDDHRCTLIYLHGFCGDGSGYLDSENELSFPWRLGTDYAPGLRAVLPSAPLLMQPWGEEEHAWFVYACEEENAVGDTSTLAATRSWLSELLHAEVERIGDASRVYLGGVSQGCSVALDTYLREAPSMGLGGFVGAIGFFPDEDLGFEGAASALNRLCADKRQARRPIWLQCATDDYETVPWELVKKTLSPAERRLPGLSVRRVCGRGHDVYDWEIRMLNKFLRTYASDAYFEQ